MPVKIRRIDLVRALLIPSTVASKNATNPEFQALRLHSDGETLSVSATDGNRRVVASSPCEGKIRVSIGADRVSQIVKGLKGEKVTLTDDGSRLSVDDGSSVVSLATVEAYDIADETKFSGMRSISIPTELFAKALSTVLHCACLDETRPMAKICLDFTGEKLTATSTDGHRLARFEHDCDVQKGRLLVASSLANTLISAANQSATMTVCDDLKSQWYVFDAIKIGCSATDGVFPETSVFKRPARSSVVDTMELIDKVSLVKNIDSRIALSWQGSSLCLNSSSENGVAKASLESSNATEAKATLNSAYLLDALRVIGSSCTLRLDGELDPVWVESYGVSCIIMPMRG